jgi:hypothetical protein
MSQRATRLSLFSARSRRASHRLARPDPEAAIIARRLVAIASIAPRWHRVSGDDFRSNARCM